MQSNRGFSARVCIHTANGLYRAGLDLCHSLLCGHVEPSEALWQADSHSMGQAQRGPLEAIAKPYSRVSAQNGAGGTGEVCGRAYT